MAVQNTSYFRRHQLTLLNLFAALLITAGCTNTAGGSGESGISFIQNETPLWTGNFGAYAADACVIKIGEVYRMYYTGLDQQNAPDPKDWTTAICLALSEDGINFSTPEEYGFMLPKATDQRPGAVFEAADISGSWEQKIETCFVLPMSAEMYNLYYGGYVKGGTSVVDGGTIIDTMGSSLALASSTDGGLSFSRKSVPVNGIILEKESGTEDEDALFSPTILFYENTYYMIYTGHSYREAPDEALSGVYLLGAVSNDGETWQKQEDPILLPALQRPDSDSAAAYDWMEWGVAEAHLILGSDGLFYLFFQGMTEGQGHRIGVARAEAPFGPYEIYPEPLIEPLAGTFCEDGVMAPYVLIDGETVRLYFNGMDIDGNDVDHWLIGYAESTWPIWVD